MDELLNVIPFKEAPTAVQDYLGQVSADNTLRLINLAQIALAG